MDQGLSAPAGLQKLARKEIEDMDGKHDGLSPGDRVDLGFLWEHCRFFDPDTGHRIKIRHRP
jgi:hypothetical protein